MSPQARPSAAEPSSLSRPVRHLKTAVVTATRALTPSMQRVTVLVEDDALQFTQPTQWLKLFVPTDDPHEEAGRASTVRRQRGRELDLDLVLHPGGPVSRWAGRTQPGDQVRVAGPRGGFTHGEPGQPYLLGGDTSAVPAIASVLESLPPGHGPVMVLLSIDQRDEAVLDLPSATLLDGHILVRWLGPATSHVPPRDPLVREVTAQSPPTRPTLAWFAGEASAMQEVRRHVSTWTTPGHRPAHVKGYWKAGRADHRD